MTWIFKGDFNGPIQAKDWTNKLSSQANPDSVNRSGLDVIVVTLYAHPLLTFSMRDSIRRQINLAHAFISQNPSWTLVKTPSEAKAAIAAGKRVLILALEGASGILESEEDLKEFIDEKGIRIVGFLHITDDTFGGTAFLKGLRALSSPFSFLESLIQPVRDSDQNRVNKNGITLAGRRMAEKLVQRKVWIDLSHASDASQRDLLPILMQAKQPLLYTHTVLRKYLKAERGISLEQLYKVAETHGFIGLIPSEEMLEGTPTESNCLDSVDTLAVHFKEASRIISEYSIGIGSDTNGAITHLPPSCNTYTEIDQNGYWNIGQFQELWKALKSRGISPLIQTQNTSYFFEAWSKLF